MNISIRKEQRSDIKAIFELTKAAFANAPHTDHNEQYIVDGLRDAKALTISLVAVLEDGKIVGHVAISPVVISDGAEHWYGLGPVSVLPQYQGQGIGAKLIHGAIEQLQIIAANGCVLLGEPDYYARFGFKAYADLVLTDVPAEYFQALLLKGILPSGEVSYHDVFMVGN